MDSVYFCRYVLGCIDMLQGMYLSLECISGNIAGLVGPYLLKKETHCSTVLDQLMRDDTFTDVTLTAQGQSLRAHRVQTLLYLCLSVCVFNSNVKHILYIETYTTSFDLQLQICQMDNFFISIELTVPIFFQIVLCLASSYFRQVLSRDMGVQSVIVLRDIKFAELRNIIHFIYT